MNIKEIRKYILAEILSKYNQLPKNEDGEVDIPELIIPEKGIYGGIYTAIHYEFENVGQSLISKIRLSDNNIHFFDGSDGYDKDCEEYEDCFLHESLINTDTLFTINDVLDEMIKNL